MRRRVPSVPFFYPDWLTVHPLSIAVCNAIRRHASGTLLDIGCGQKPYEVAGVNVSRWIGIDVATNEAADMYGPADEIELPDSSVDTILCTQVLEHVPSPIKVLIEFSRLLRPGGIAIISAPQYWPLHEEPLDFFRYTEPGLRQMMQEVDFEVFEFESQGNAAHMVGQVLNNGVLAFGEGTNFFNNFLFRCTKVPIYLFVNLFAIGLSTILSSKRDVMNHVVVARKRL